MMTQLIAIGDQIQAGLREFLSQRPFSRAIRGVQLDIDDYWELGELSRQLHHGFGPFYPPYGFLPLEARLHHQQQRLLLGHYKANMDFKPPGWGQHCRAMGYPSGAEPVIIRVILKREGPPELTDLPRHYFSYPIVYEVRAQNRALVSLGLFDWLHKALAAGTGQRTERAPSIGRADPNTAGTLGGVLGSADPRKSYLVTCAHVLGPPGTAVYHPGPFEGKHSEPIASVRHWKIPLAGNVDDPCSEAATPNALRLDLAIAELAVGSDMFGEMGYVTTANAVGTIEAIRKHDRVSFAGKTRGRIDAKVGALTLWDQVEFADGVRCFGRIFEIKPSTRQYLREDLAQPGDSGSWLIFERDDLVTWYGMVMSCDGGQAYACFAEYILDECNGSGAFPGGLSLLA